MSTHVKKHSLGNIEDHSDGLEWTSLKTSMSGYATLSGAVFTGPVRVPSLSAQTWITTPSLTSTNIVNTNSISTNSLTATGGIYVNDLVSQSDLSSSIDLGNQTIYDNTSAISFEWTTRLFKDSQEVNSIDYENRNLIGNWNVNGTSLSSELSSKVDKVLDAVSGDLAVWDASGGIYDSSLPLSSVLILDSLGQIDQMRYLPSIYLKNKTPSLTAFCHEIWIETNANNEDYVVVGTRTRIDPTSPITFTWTGIIDGNLSDCRNYSPKAIPTSIDNVIVDETRTNQPSSGSLTCNLLSVQNNGTVPSVNAVVLGASCLITGDVNFDSVVGFVSYNQATLNTGTFYGYSYNSYGKTVTIGSFYDHSKNEGIVTNGTFYDSSLNFGGIVTTGIFYGNSGNTGTVTFGTFYNTSSNYDGYVTDGYFHDNSYNLYSVSNGYFYDDSYNDIGGIVTWGTFYPTFIEGALEDPWTYTVNNGTVDNATCYWLAIDNTLGGTITYPPVIYAGYPV